jgi:hypothetical protein
MTATPAQRNLAAEVRAVEEGHRAVVQPGGWVRVKSDTVAGKFYRVEFTGWRGELVSFSCRPDGDRAYRGDHMATGGAGVTPCKHAALAARRLELKGLAHLDERGYWISDGPDVPDAVADERARILRRITA